MRLSFRCALGHWRIPSDVRRRRDGVLVPVEAADRWFNRKRNKMGFKEPKCW